MNFLQRFWSRLMANKITSALGVIFFFSCAVTAFPKSVGWLPKDAQAMVFDIAHYTIMAALTALYFFVKQHSTVGDAGGTAVQPPPTTK